MAENSASSATNPDIRNGSRDFLFQAVRWIIIISFSVMVFSAWAQVIFRYIIQYPLGWTGELCRIMLFWFAFMSVGTLVLRRGMMRVDAFITGLPPKWQAVVSVVVHLIQAAFFTWLIYLSMRLVFLAANQVSTALRVPYSYIYFSLPLGLAVGVIYSLKITWSDIKGLSSGRIRTTERGEGEGL